MGAFLLKKLFIIIINNFSNQSYLVYGNFDSISILSKVNKQNPISQIYFTIKGKLDHGTFFCVLVNNGNTIFERSHLLKRFKKELED